LAYSELCRARSLLDISMRGGKTVDVHEMPDLRITAGITPADPDKIQKQMPDRVQLVEYAAVNDKLIIWLISKTGIKSQLVKISQADLTRRVKQYLEMIGQPPGRDGRPWQERAADLYDILIRPIEGSLDKQKVLCIVPDKILSRLPFGTLVQHKSDRNE